jgi:hypothetical protein
VPVRFAGRAAASRCRGAALINNRAALEAFEFEANTAGDNPFDGLAGQRICLQRIVRHPLSYLKSAWFALGVERNSFINVGWHGGIVYAHVCSVAT